MKIKKIKLVNFRNYPELEIDINHDIVILTGPNAVGKTNLLESVYFASLFKSFRDDNEFIFLKDTENIEIKMLVEKEDVAVWLEIFLSRKGKIFASFVVDGVKKKRKEAQGYLRVVIFDPTDVDMFSKPPESRRRYLNMVLSQGSAEYLEWVTDYKRILLQKNRLLNDIKQNKAEKRGLEEWNKQLAYYGAKIINFRNEYIDFLNHNISEVYSSISGFHRPVEVFYQTTQGQTTEEIEKNLLNSLQNLENKEVMFGSCLVGPHRDDVSLKSEGLFLPPFSSRGELRSQVLALKIMELEYLSKNGEAPILLLDDVLSELDETRRTYLLKYLQNRFQTFITTTHPLEMPAQHITLAQAVAEESQE